MAHAAKRKSNGRVMPSLANEFFPADKWFGPSLFEWDEPLLGYEWAGSIPEANLIETEKAYEIELAAPGLEKKDFTIELQDGMLHIRAEKEEEQSAEDKNYRRKEFSYFSFSRSFALPDNLLVDKIEASYTHGILHLTLPKKEVIVSKPVKQIKVG